MGRNVTLDFSAGGGSDAEFLIGTITLEPTAVHEIGNRVVLPAPRATGINAGVGVLEDVAISPAGPEPAWAYRATVRDSISGKAQSWLVGVPTGTSAIPFKQLTKFTTTIPPQTTAGMMQNWANTTEANADRSELAADRAEAPTDLMNKSLIEDPESETSTALSVGFTDSSEGLLTASRAPAPVNSRTATTFQPGHGYVALNTNTTLSDDSTSFMLGSQSLKIVSKSTGDAAVVQKTGQALNAVNKDLRLLIKIDNMDAITGVHVYAGDDTMSGYYQWTIADSDPSGGQHYMKSGEFTWITLGFSSAATVGTPNRGNLTNIRVTTIPKVGSVATVSLNAVTLVEQSLEFPAGVVSFSYDDSYVSHYTEARKALDKHGYTGTFYTICSLIDSDSGWMTLAQLHKLQDAGHEVAAHAYNYDDHQTGFHNMTAPQLSASLRKMRKWLTDNGFKSGDHMAYPQGGFNKTVLEVSAKYHTSARTVIRRTSETLLPNDVMKLRSFSVTDTDTVATIKSRIDAAKAEGSWLILTFHHLVTTPTIPQHFSIASHQELVDYCKTVGVAVAPVGNVLARVKGEKAIADSTATPDLAAAVNSAMGNSPTRMHAVPRHITTNVVGGVITGDLNLTCFTPIVDTTIGALTARTGTTAWAGTTLARLGLYTADELTGAITLVAATANDLNLFSAPSATYRAPLSTGGGLPATYTLKAGQRYAVGVLGVGITAGTLVMGSMNPALAARVPRTCGKVSGLSDLPASGTIVETGNFIWVELGP